MTVAEYKSKLIDDRARLLDAMAWVVTKGASGKISGSAFTALSNRASTTADAWWDVEAPHGLASTDKAWRKAVRAIGNIEQPSGDLRRLRSQMTACLALVTQTHLTGGDKEVKAVITNGLSKGLWVHSASDTYKSSCRTVAYKVINKDADRLKGRKYKITRQVFQIQDAGAGQYWEGYPGELEPRTSILLSVTNEGYGFWDDNVAVAYEGRLKNVYENDIITVYGTCIGQYSYESIAGYNMTVPAIEAEYVSQ